jgi:NTP pyrophosphatase (non-canonical NTP hydrolase)
MDKLFSTIVEDIARINKIDRRTVTERFVKYNEEFGEFSAEVVKMIGMTQKPYDELHLIEESADALQCLISLILHVCEEKSIDFNLVLNTILEKDKKWEAKIKEYTRHLSPKHLVKIEAKNVDGFEGNTITQVTYVSADIEVMAMNEDVITRDDVQENDEVFSTYHEFTSLGGISDEEMKVLRKFNIIK